MKVHALLDLIPVHDSQSYRRLKADIQINGILDPIYVMDSTNEIVDGRARWKISQELGLTNVPFVRLTDPADIYPRLMVNLNRRHLTKAQMGLFLGLIAEKTNGKNYAARMRTAREKTGLTTTHVGDETARRGNIIAKKDPRRAAELIQRGGYIPMKKLSDTLTAPSVEKRLSDAAGYMMQARNLLMAVSQDKGRPPLTESSTRSLLDIRDSIEEIQDLTRAIVPSRRRSQSKGAFHS